MRSPFTSRQEPVGNRLGMGGDRSRGRTGWDLSWTGEFVEEGMTKCFRSDDLNQSLLMPPSLHDWLPENHLARFVADLVETLDLSAFYRSYEAKDGRGQAAYSPVLMVRLLV